MFLKAAHHTPVKMYWQCLSSCFEVSELEKKFINRTQNSYAYQEYKWQLHFLQTWKPCHAIPLITVVVIDKGSR